MSGMTRRTSFARSFSDVFRRSRVGLNAVAAPVRNATGDVVAAVGVSGPSYRLTVDSFPEVSARLLDGAHDRRACRGRAS